MDPTTPDRLATSRRHLLAGAGVMASALLGGCAAAAPSGAGSSVVASAGTVRSTTPTTDTADRTVYLTFDDGPVAGFTEQILAHLRASGVRATFFLVGNRMVGNPALVKRIIDAGHVVGTHSWSHQDFGTLNTEQARREIEQPITWLRTQLAHTSTLFRYPFGTSSREGDTALWQLGQRPHWWHLGPADWDPAVPDATIIKDVMDGVAPGSVIDLHDAAEGMPPRKGPTYLPGLLAQLKAAGYTFGVLDASRPYPGELD